MNKNFLTLLLFASLSTFFFSQQIFAQFGLPFIGGHGPKQFGVRYDYFDAANIHQIVGEFSRTRNFGGLTSRSPLGYFSTMNFAGGARFLTDRDSTSFVWRIGLVDAEFQRKIWIIGVTIVDLDRSGSLDRNFRWANGRIGPGFTIGGKKLSISPQFVGVIGSSSLILGKENYSALGKNADSTFAGIEAGFRAALPVRIGRRVLLVGMYTDRTLIDGPEPHFKTFLGELRVHLGKRRKSVTFFANYRRETVSFNNSSLEIENNFVQAGLRLNLIPERRVNPWDDF